MGAWMQSLEGICVRGGVSNLLDQGGGRGLGRRLGGVRVGEE